MLGYLGSLALLFAVTLGAALLLRANHTKWYRWGFNLMGLIVLLLVIRSSVTVVAQLTTEVYFNVLYTSRDELMDNMVVLTAQSKAGDGTATNELRRLRLELQDWSGPNGGDRFSSIVASGLIFCLLLSVLPLPVISLLFGLTALTDGAITNRAELRSDSWHVKIWREVYPKQSTTPGETKDENICHLSWSFGWNIWIVMLLTVLAWGLFCLWFVAQPVWLFLYRGEIYNPFKLNDPESESGEDYLKVSEAARIGAWRLFGVRLSPLLIAVGVELVWMAHTYLLPVAQYSILGLMAILVVLDVIWWCLGWHRPIKELRPFDAEHSPVTNAVEQSAQFISSKIGLATREDGPNLWQNLHRAVCPKLTEQ